MSCAAKLVSFNKYVHKKRQRHKFTGRSSDIKWWMLHVLISGSSVLIIIWLLSPATSSLWDTHSATVHSSPILLFSPPVLPLRYHFPSALPLLYLSLPPLSLPLPLGASLTSTCTPTSETRRGVEEGGVRGGRAGSRKHPCLTCSPDTRENRATRRCVTLPRQTPP